MSDNKKNLGYQPGNQRGYQPTKTTPSAPKEKPAAPTNTPKGDSAGKKQ